jgi:hypothetical protein
MSTPDSWQARNSEYLAAALAWLRLKLADAVRRARGTPSADDESAAIAAARLRLDLAVSVEPPPALELLARSLAMSDFERDLLLLCVAMELDTRTVTLCAAAQGEARPYPTYALALSLFDDAAWDALSPERPLRYWRLIEINQPAAQPLISSALRADERIVSFAKGLNYLDDRVAPLTSPVPAVTLDSLPGSQREVAQQVIAAVQATAHVREPIVLVGRDRDSKQQVAAAVAISAGLHLYRLPAEILPSHAGELETLARLWQRESILLPIALYVDAHELERNASSPESLLPRVARFVGRSGGLMFISTRDPPPAVIHPLVAVDVETPTPAEQRSAWLTALGGSSTRTAQRLAGQFNLNRHEIAAIAMRARNEEDAAPVEERVWRTCRMRTRPMLERLAERIDAKATWGDIVLPPTETGLLHQVAAQVDARSRVYDDWGFRARMNRGFGISALFAGESGTGKTMAAEVLANALNLDLYRIDLSAVVSKYIGETEKNLRQVFDEAENGGAILLFDEADALFGKRSEVKDSHDRYANIEINYLLQRMEAYRGLAILATNMKSALDSAFMRRLRFIIKFPFPQGAERRLMWERAFPKGTPLGVLDYDRLSKLGVTGGTIHNIALNAAFAAAHANTPVTMAVILDAARTEFRKTDRPVNDADFRWVEPKSARS